MNYLPRKLEKLRKHYNYSQSYLAEFLGIDVVEYMGYENGRSMISYQQMKKLASLYHINIVEIFKNSDEVTLYDVAEARTDEINIEYFIPKKTFISRLKEHPFIAGGFAGLIIALIVVSIVLIGKNNSPYVSSADNTDRLAASNSSIIYIDNVGAVKGSGDNSNGQISNLPSEKAVKVVEGSNYSIILLEDGSVLSYGLIDKYQKEISEWTNIIDIASGLNHVVAVDKNGRMYCVGNNSNGECNIGSFDDIKNVYATPTGTIGVNNSGKIYYTGSFVGTSTLKKYENVLDIDASADNLIILKEDGTCDYVASYDNSIYFDVSRWTNIVDVTCGNDFFAGLKQDGSVVVASMSLDEDVVSEWKNIIAIASGDDYLVALDGNEIFGVGKNNYHQFPSDINVKQSLTKVQNIFVDYDSDNVNVSFDLVDNATEYEVRLLLDDGTEMMKRVTNNKVSFETTSLKDNSTYTISIVAVGSGIYDNSPESKTNFIYLVEKKEEVVEEKIKIRSDLAGSSREEFENYLHSLSVTDIEAIESENLCDGFVETVEEINGITPGSTYTTSELLSRKISYSYCKINMESENNESENLEG